MKTITRKNIRVDGNKISFTLCSQTRYGVIEKECSFIAKNEDEIKKAKTLMK